MRNGHTGVTTNQGLDKPFFLLFSSLFSVSSLFCILLLVIILKITYLGCNFKTSLQPKSMITLPSIKQIFEFLKRKCREFNTCVLTCEDFFRSPFVNKFIPSLLSLLLPHANTFLSAVRKKEPSLPAITSVMHFPAGTCTWKFPETHAAWSSWYKTAYICSHGISIIQTKLINAQASRI